MGLPSRSDVTASNEDVMTSSSGFRGRSGSDITAGRRKTRPTHTLVRPPSADDVTAPSDMRQRRDEFAADVTRMETSSKVIEIAPILAPHASDDVSDVRARRSSPTLDTSLLKTKKMEVDDVIRRKRDAAAMAADRACPDLEAKVNIFLTPSPYLTPLHQSYVSMI